MKFKKIKSLLIVITAFYSFAIAQNDTIRNATTNDMFRFYAKEHIGKKIEKFHLVAQNNLEINSNELRNIPVLFLFWDLNVCNECKAEIEITDSLYRLCLSKDIKFVSLIPNSQIELFEFQQKNAINFPIVASASKFASFYGGLLGSPRLYFIDKEHIVKNIIVEATFEETYLKAKSIISSIE